MTAPMTLEQRIEDFASRCSGLYYSAIKAEAATLAAAVREEAIEEARPRAEVMHIAFLSKDRTDTEGYFARELMRLAALKDRP